MEVCSLRDAATNFEKLGVTVYGISMDDVASQAKFAKMQKLNFSLLSDPDGSVATKYGVGGRRFPRRNTFVIDEKGVLRHISKKVNVRAHGKDLAELIQKLRK